MSEMNENTSVNGVESRLSGKQQYSCVQVRYLEKTPPADFSERYFSGDCPGKRRRPETGGGSDKLGQQRDPVYEGNMSAGKTDCYSIPCKYCMPVSADGSPLPLRGVILGIHGFSGSKESTGLCVLSERIVPEGYGLVCFDLPAHWKSPARPEMLTVENAVRDILFMAEECRREFPDLPKYIFATSFGAYLTLLCCQAGGSRDSGLSEGGLSGGDHREDEIKESGGRDSGLSEGGLSGGDHREDEVKESGGRNSGLREERFGHVPGGPLADFHIILRAPAVTMPEVFIRLLNMTPMEFRAKEPCDCSTDPARPLMVYYSFYESLLRHSVFRADPDVYPPMLVMHGDADEVVPPQDVRKFCGKYPQADLHVLPGCDHSFSIPGALDEMTRLVKEQLLNAR